jgi:alkylhydroperoxidase/carboxymuconolactone decarboxylase family protein YurZ
MPSRVADSRTTLRRLTIRDDAFVQQAMASETVNLAESGLDPKTHALVRMGAMIALGAAEPSYRQIVEAARVAGASTDEVVGTLVAVMTATGVPRVVAAAPAVGLAIGYDVHAALEQLDGPVEDTKTTGAPAPRRTPQARTRREG